MKQQNKDKVFVKLFNPHLTNIGIADELSVTGIKIRARGNCNGRKMPPGTFWKEKNCRIVAYRRNDAYLVVFGRFPEVVQAASLLGRIED